MIYICLYLFVKKQTCKQISIEIYIQSLQTKLYTEIAWKKLSI